MLARYLRMIQVQRGDFNGRVLTIRRDDLGAIACILDVAPDGGRGPARRARRDLPEQRLGLTGLRPRPAPATMGG